MKITDADQVIDANLLRNPNQINTGFVGRIDRTEVVQAPACAQLRVLPLQNSGPRNRLQATIAASRMPMTLLSALL